MTLPKQSMVWSRVRPQAEWSQSVRKARNWEEKNNIYYLNRQIQKRKFQHMPILFNFKILTETTERNMKQTTTDLVWCFVYVTKEVQDNLVTVSGKWKTNINWISDLHKEKVSNILNLIMKCSSQLFLFPVRLQESSAEDTIHFVLIYSN